MAEYAPDAIRAAFDTIHAAIPSAQLSGIIGDQNHDYGYHRGRDFISPNDYSCQQSDDKQGSGQAANGLDVSLPPDQMQAVTRRLSACVDNGDSRLQALREFYGTMDGVNVTGRDVRTKAWVTSDDSHLWHVHLSGYRRWADDHAAWQQIASAFIGSGSDSGGSGGSEDMGTFETNASHKTQAVTNAWKTLYITDDDNSQTWFSGPCVFQAQANVVFSGLVAPNVAKFRWVTVDHRQSDGYEKPDYPNEWPTIEVPPTSGGTYASLVQFGKIGAPPSGYSRRLRLQAYVEQASGVSVTYVRASSFRQ